MLRPGAPVSPDDVVSLVEKRMSGLETVFCLATEFESALMHTLEERGYILVQEFSQGSAQRHCQGQEALSGANRRRIAAIGG